MSSKISLTAAAAKNEPGLDVEVDAELFKCEITCATLCKALWTKAF